MRALGKKYLVTWAGAAAAAAVAAVLSLVGQVEIAVAALALAVLGLLVTSVLSRLAPHRGRPRPATTERAPVDIGHVVESAVIAEHVRTQQYLDRELEQRSAQLRQHVEVVVDDRLPRVAAEVLAALRLRERHGDLGLPDIAGHTAGQTLALLDTVRALRPDRVLVIGADADVSWLGRELQGVDGRATVVVDGLDTEARVTAAVRAHGLESTLGVTAPPRIEPAVPHGFLPWYDLSALPDGGAVDLVVIGWAGLRELRATLPVLPLVLERLTPAGAVAVVGPERQAELVGSWTAGGELAVEPALSSAGVAVLRRARG